MKVVSKVVLLLVMTGSFTAGTVGAASADPSPAQALTGVVVVPLGPGVCC